METCKKLFYAAVILAVILTVNVFGDTSYSDIDPNGDGVLSLGSITARWDANLDDVSVVDLTAAGDVTLGVYDLLFTTTAPTVGGKVKFSNIYGNTAELNLLASSYLKFVSSAGVAFVSEPTRGLGDGDFPWQNLFATALHSNSLTTLTGDLSITAAGGDVNFDDENLKTTGDLEVTGQIISDGGTVGAPGFVMSTTGLVNKDTGFYRIGNDNWGWASAGSKAFDFSQFGLGIRSGSILSPSYTFIIDFDTGMYRVDGDQLGFTAGGQKTLHIVEAAGSPRTKSRFPGWLGIGADSAPTKALDVTGAATIDTTTLVVDAVNHRVGIGTATPGYILDINAGEIDDDNYDGLRIVDTGWDATSHPMLEFYNSHASFNGSLARIYGEIGILGENSKLYFAVADSSKNLQDRMVIDKDGNIGIGLTAVDANYKLIVRRAANVNFGIGLIASELAIAAFNDAISANIPMRFYASEFNLLNGNVGINETSPQDKLEVNGTVLVKDKLKFTQDDGNEYIDSLNDGFMDYGATTLHRFNAPIRTTTTLYRRYYHLPIGSFDPGASGATWTNPNPNHTGGWRLNSDSEVLIAGTDIHSDWDGASDIIVEIRFALNAAGVGDDVVDLNLVAYYNGLGDTATKTQTVEVNTATDGTQYKSYKATFTLEYDKVDNVIDAGDEITFILNLLDTSDPYDAIITGGTFFYNTTHVGIEAGDT